MTSQNTAPANRLASETSPYLLQHAHNPVDWFPWGTEAFAAARSQNKPIFVSVGYSTCYWCHVMERECFEDPAVAALMNELFISIKVDREERPDVDQLYMTAVQILTRRGGWPMSVFLTPDLRPFYGGTYFPKDDMAGRPGFMTLLRSLSRAFHDRSPEVTQSANQLVDVLTELAQPALPEKSITIDLPLIQRLIDQSASDYDPRHGGFGGAPKFPRQTLLETIFAFLAHHPNERLLKQVTHTLDALAQGGIRDHLGGAFHRYSTDAKWRVPHFEIMLYDNAMLAWLYVEAYRQTELPFYAETARGIFDFVLREMTSSEGAFYTAFDAEVDHREGQSYLWTEAEIIAILGQDDARLFNNAYGVDRGPNFEDPHGGPGYADQNVLYLPEPLSPEVNQQLEPMRGKLLAERSKRKQPLLDTKVITGWNALMIRALAHAGQVLQEERYLSAARSCADFLLRHHRLPDGGLLRTSRDGTAKYDGFLDDYAFLIRALIDLRNADGHEGWKDHAASLMISVLGRFQDPSTGGFFFTAAGAEDLIVRQKVASDSPLPSGNAQLALALLDLAQADEARAVIQAFAGPLSQQPEAMSSMLEAAFEYVHRFGPIEVPAGNTPGRPISPTELAESVVQCSAQWASKTEAILTLAIAEGYHLNSNQTTGKLVATQLEVTNAEASVDFPVGIESEFSFTAEPLCVYFDQINIRLRLASPPAGPLHIRLTYQACTNDACYPAIVKRIEIPLQNQT